MNTILFQGIDRANDSLWIGKEFFNSINNMFFLRTISYLVDEISYGDEYSDCEFPNDLEDNEEIFEGVRFRYYDDEIIVSEAEFKDLLILACKKYGKINHVEEDVKKIIEVITDSV